MLEFFLKLIYTSYGTFSVNKFSRSYIKKLEKFILNKNYENVDLKKIIEYFNKENRRKREIPKKGYRAYKYSKREFYRGFWKDGKKDGLGFYKWANGDVYKGKL